jgi:2-polyprenyl-3-methyl-5-hydroxy-6-metoxy-1,4-benzoquinol methylase
MSRTSFEIFGRLATTVISWTELSGRYSFQDSTEPRIVADIAGKLRLSANDTLLEIGCGAGNLLIPLSAMVRQTTGVDHASLVQKLGERCPAVHRIAGNFLDIEIAGRYSKILIYSVLHYLTDEAEIAQFVMKATRLLEPEGLLLIGDIANVDKKKAFEASLQGQEFLQDWRRTATAGRVIQVPDPERVIIDDGVIGRLQSRLQSSGFDLVKLPQPEGLPMCYTREDLLVSHARLGR